MSKCKDCNYELNEDDNYEGVCPECYQVVLSIFDGYNIDELTVSQIKMLIADNEITEESVRRHFNNEWWDETP